MHGGERKYFHQLIGGNFRLDSLQASVVRVKLPHLNKWHKQRQVNAEHYNELFDDAGLKGKVTIPFTEHSRSLKYYHMMNMINY